MFELYLQLGIDHIADLAAYDHILFIVALCAVYRLTQWRRILILVTAFTLGHSVTLALAALKVIALPVDIIEFLIPVTIFATAILNVVRKEGGRQKMHGTYLLVLFFGFIHGVGFSNYFRSLLGREADIILPLFAFNLGVEIGQLFIVCIILAVSFLFIRIIRVRQRDWNLVVSGGAAGIALILMTETWPFG